MDPSSGADSTPKVAIDGSGKTIAVWQQSDGTANSIFASRYVRAGWAGQTPFVEADFVYGIGSSQIQFDQNGNGIAVWNQGYDIYARRYNKAGDTWEPVDLKNTRTTSSHIPRSHAD